MTTSQLPTPVTLEPVAEDKNLLTVIEDNAGSCCGGSACGTGN